jgi:Putative MetA-pathway of phenol degradation
MRQEWIDAANGVFYRQWVLGYQYRNRNLSKGDHHLGSWSIFAPLNRRLEVLLTVPYLDALRLPTKATSTAHSTDAGRSHLVPFLGQVGDLSVAPQILFHETSNTSVMVIMTITTPTGGVSGGNHNTSLEPQLQFWQGLPRQWVLRESIGATVPLAPSPARTNLNCNLTVGKLPTDGDAKYFKEFTV